MRISDKLAGINAARFHTGSQISRQRMPDKRFWHLKVCLYWLAGRNLQRRRFRFCPKHLRMLSGLYGVLRPLDLMQLIVWKWGSVLRMPEGKICINLGRYHHQQAERGARSTRR